MATTIAKGVDNSPGEYALGYSHAEHHRLIRQATLFAPFTEGLFRDAGIGPGQHVLDLGSGVGDVSLLLARMVGPSGDVVGIERDAMSITRADARVRAAGFHNVSFREGDIAKIAIREDFDAVVGRLILEFLPDAGAAVASLAGLIRPGGLLAIQDAYWGSLLQLTAGLPLFSKSVSLVYKCFQLSGAHVDMERILYRGFREAGFPTPSLRIDVPVGDPAVFSQWTSDLMCSLLPQMQRHGLACDDVGELEMLSHRLESELIERKMFGTAIGLVAAWSRKS